MPSYTQAEINALQVVNQFKQVLASAPIQLGISNPQSIAVTLYYTTGTLSYDIVTVPTEEPTP